MATDIVLRGEPTPLLPMEPDQAALMMHRFRELCEAILTKDDVVGIPGEDGFVKRSGWSKLATFYSISTVILEHTVDYDDDGVPVHSRARVRATSPAGRVEDGDGACAITEPRFKSPTGRQKVFHDLPATAVTRARNRAISNLVGFGAVSAEEADEGPGPARPFGEAASRSEEDGLLRALEDLGASPVPANRVVNEAGYLPRVAARMAMFIARDVADRQKAEDEADGARGYDDDAVKGTGADAEPTP
jgi:hypothetical protein